MAKRTYTFGDKTEERPHLVLEADGAISEEAILWLVYAAFDFMISKRMTNFPYTYDDGKCTISVNFVG